MARPPQQPTRAHAHGESKRGASTVINFYNRDEPYYEFTNFWDRHPIVLDGQTWQTSEHYFQAQKFISFPAAVEAVRTAPTPRAAFDIARRYDQLKRKDWDEAKDAVMFRVVFAKFTQHKYLHDLLWATGDAWLVEHTKNDNFWGDGGDGTGKNKLGQTLMRVRAEIQAKPVQFPPLPQQPAAAAVPSQPQPQTHAQPPPAQTQAKKGWAWW